jgi:hypothetical protein
MQPICGRGAISRRELKTVAASPFIHCVTLIDRSEEIDKRERFVPAHSMEPENHQLKEEKINLIEEDLDAIPEQKVRR